MRIYYAGFYKFEPEYVKKIGLKELRVLWSFHYKKELLRALDGVRELKRKMAEEEEKNGNQ